jgi:hypothetical protein
MKLHIWCDLSLQKCPSKRYMSWEKKKKKKEKKRQRHMLKSMMKDKEKKCTMLKA